MRTALLAVAALILSGPAMAQYYAPPPGYPPPGYAPPGYSPPPPYYPPPPPRGRFGSRCDAVIRTPYGPEQMICPLVEPKPLGFECACPAPRRAGYAPGSFLPGRTIR